MVSRGPFVRVTAHQIRVIFVIIAMTILSGIRETNERDIVGARECLVISFEPDPMAIWARHIVTTNRMCNHFGQTTRIIVCGRLGHTQEESNPQIYPAAGEWINGGLAHIEDQVLFTGSFVEDLGSVRASVRREEISR